MTILKYSKIGSDFFTSQLMNQLVRETNGALRTALDSSEVHRVGFNVFEEEEKFTIEMAIPGFSKQDIRLKVENGILSISASKEDKEDRNYLRREFYRADFEKDLKLAEGIDEEAICAEVKDGILLVSLPKVKVEDQKVREIEIR